jgi:crotonobetainyl-CoA:carnitine CoA-transferase CaiB-like acyl-CoA transferase
MTSRKKEMSAEDPFQSSALSDITVVDLTRILAGPYCTMMLGDLGAEVIKVEPPRGDDSRGWGPPFVSGESAYFLAVNRNKKSVCINLKMDEGKDVLRRLLQQADVLVENFRPGALERLGFGYSQLEAELPRLVYCSISGYGHTGPWSERPGYDAVMQGEAGWMHLTGLPGGEPLKVGASLADVFTGMMAAQGILTALHERSRTGRGQKVDIALFDSVVATLCYQAQGYLLTGREPERLGNRHPSLTPYETFETQDGHLILGVGNDSLWQRFCLAVGRPDLDEPRFRTNAQRVENHPELEPLLQALFKTMPTGHWIDVLESAGIPVGRVRSVSEVFKNPQVEPRQMLFEADHPTVGPMKMTGNPIKLSGSGGRSVSPPPLLGQHTEDVLSSKLKLSSEQINALENAGAVHIYRESKS